MEIPVRCDSCCNIDSDAASSFQAEGGEGPNSLHIRTGLHRPAVDHVALEFRTEMCSHGRRPALLLHWLVCGGLGRGTRARRRILGCHCCKPVLGNWNVAAQTCLRKAPEFVGSRPEGFPKGDFTQGFVRIETPQRQLVPRCSSAPRVLGTLSLLLVPRPPYSAGFLRRHNSISTCIKIAKHVHRGRNCRGIQASTVAAKSSGACYGPACPLTQEA